LAMAPVSEEGTFCKMEGYSTKSKTPQELTTNCNWAMSVYWPADISGADIYDYDFCGSKWFTFKNWNFYRNNFFICEFCRLFLVNFICLMFAPQMSAPQVSQ
jgi:hypothetical protein